jgi:hypothetical protein
MERNPKPLGRWFIIRKLGFINVVQFVCETLFCVKYYYVLKLNLKKLNPRSVERTPRGTLVAIQPQDFEWIKTHLKNLPRHARREILSRINFYNKGFHNCYVMKTGDDVACLQWLVEPKENPVIREFYKRMFYPLHETQVMVDNVFTFPQYRGRGYQSIISRNLLELALDRGYTSAIVYIQNDRISTLNDFFDMGFKITKRLYQMRILGVTFRNL